VQSKEAENVVRSYLFNQSPSSHRIAQDAPNPSFSCVPQPDEAFDFPGGSVVVEYESQVPLQSVEKYWWLLQNADYLPEGKKLALVVIVLDAWAQPVDQVERQKALANKLEAAFPGRFRFFYVGAEEASPDTISAALSGAYQAVNA
jgi:hypothetical protein